MRPGEDSDVARKRLHDEYNTLLNKRAGGFATSAELERYDELHANITNFQNIEG